MMMKRGRTPPLGLGSGHDRYAGAANYLGAPWNNRTPERLAGLLEGAAHANSSGTRA